VECVSLKGVDKWSLTPKGLVPSQCVRTVPSGSHVSTDGEYIRVKKPNGQVEFIEECKYDYREMVTGDSGPIAYATTTAATETSWDYMESNFEVPANPKANNGQSLFFFNELVNTNAKITIQTALQWGPSQAGGGASWGAAVWWTTPNGTVINSDLIGCRTGSTMISLLNNYGWWECVMQHGTNQTFLIISQQNVRPNESLAAVGMRAYTISSCANYPSDGSMNFYNLALEDNAMPVRPTWSPVVDFTDCNQKVNATSDTVFIMY